MICWWILEVQKNTQLKGDRLAAFENLNSGI